MKSVCMQTAGRFLRDIRGARQRDPLDAAESAARIGRLLGRLEILEDVDRVVGIEVADALGDVARRQVLEDLDADRLVELGQRGEVEVVAEQADQRRARSSASSASSRSPTSAS